MAPQAVRRCSRPAPWGVAKARPQARADATALLSHQAPWGAKTSLSYAFVPFQFFSTSRCPSTMSISLSK
eukprot:9789612-Lingulodinium_polyedra.AAC.1